MPEVVSTTINLEPDSLVQRRNPNVRRLGRRAQEGVLVPQGSQRSYLECGVCQQGLSRRFARIRVVAVNVMKVALLRVRSPTKGYQFVGIVQVY